MDHSDFRNRMTTLPALSALMCVHGPPSRPTTAHLGAAAGAIQRFARERGAKFDRSAARGTRRVFLERKQQRAHGSARPGGMRVHRTNARRIGVRVRKTAIATRGLIAPVEGSPLASPSAAHKRIMCVDRGIGVVADQRAVHVQCVLGSGDLRARKRGPHVAVDGSGHLRRGGIDIAALSKPICEGERVRPDARPGCWW